jgi:hypothetical protein
MANGVPAKRISPGKNSSSEGTWNSPPPSAALIDVVVVSVLRMHSLVGDGQSRP